ncbi:MAG: hypothetical protein WCP01_02620, partial [Methylococcaceae bacterium]
THPTKPTPQKPNKTTTPNVGWVEQRETHQLRSTHPTKPTPQKPNKTTTPNVGWVEQRETHQHY